jgi:hypothetical protein
VVGEETDPVGFATQFMNARHGITVWYNIQSCQARSKVLKNRAL